MFYHFFADISSGKPIRLRSSKWSKIENEQNKRYPFCVQCKTVEKLNVHHILPFHLFPEYELDFNNLITLCRSCHYIYGHGKDWKAYQPEVVYFVKNHIEYAKVIRERIYTVDNAITKLLVEKLKEGKPLWH